MDRVGASESMRREQTFFNNQFCNLWAVLLNQWRTAQRLY